jgi:predicted HTH transcriptional regulator
MRRVASSRGEAAVTDQDIESLLDRGFETPGVEFKARGRRTNPEFLAKIVRAVIGMANRRDGGFVFIGIDPDTLEPDGLEDDQADTWGYDDLATSVNEYANPSVSFDLETKLFQGHKLVIIQVHEFTDIPILCGKDFHQTNVKGAAPVLRRGACYVRSRHKPETVDIPSEEEMRELLELAVDKGLRKFVARAHKAGLLSFGPGNPVTAKDEEIFKKQIEELG